MVTKEENRWAKLHIEYELFYSKERLAELRAKIKQLEIDLEELKDDSTIG